MPNGMPEQTRRLCAFLLPHPLLQLHVPCLARASLNLRRASSLQEAETVTGTKGSLCAQEVWGALHKLSHCMLSLYSQVGVIPILQKNVKPRGVSELA